MLVLAHEQRKKLACRARAALLPRWELRERRSQDLRVDVEQVRAVRVRRFVRRVFFRASVARARSSSDCGVAPARALHRLGPRPHPQAAASARAQDVRDRPESLWHVTRGRFRFVPSRGSSRAAGEQPDGRSRALQARGSSVPARRSALLQLGIIREQARARRARRRSAAAARGRARRVHRSRAPVVSLQDGSRCSQLVAATS